MLQASPSEPIRPRRPRVAAVLATAAWVAVLPILLARCSEEPQEVPGATAKPGSAGTEPASGPGPSVRNGGSGDTSRRPDPEDLIAYPQDADRVVSSVNGRKNTLRDLIRHIDSRHFAGFEKLVSLPAGQHDLRTPRLADWVRQHADVVALRTEARERGIPESLIAEESGRALTAAFEEFKTRYQQRNQRPFPTQPEAAKAVRDGFLKDRGLSLEIDGLLAAMVPEAITQQDADEYYKLHREAVNGVLEVAHILVVNREPRTGALFSGEKMRAVHDKVAEIKRRLEAGAPFAKVAVEMSEDKVTAPSGGVLRNLLRIDPRMPASFCRAAWSMRDGKWTGPIETRYGLHFVHRIRWLNIRTILRLLASNAGIRKLVRTHHQEDLLFQVRKKHRVELLY